MEQLGAGSRPEGVQALMELALEFVGTHGTETAQSRGLQSTESLRRRSAGRKASAARYARPMMSLATGDDHWPFGERVWPNGLSHATPPIRTIWGTKPYPPKGALSRGGSAQ